MHYYVVSHHANKSLRCHNDIDDARMDILKELYVGLQAYMPREDVYDIREVTGVMHEASCLDPIGSYIDEYADMAVVGYRGRSWHIDECNNVTCTDDVRGIFDW